MVFPPEVTASYAPPGGGVVEAGYGDGAYPPAGGPIGPAEQMGPSI
jgi:hypothetical protein